MCARISASGSASQPLEEEEPRLCDRVDAGGQRTGRLADGVEGLFLIVSELGIGAGAIHNASSPRSRLQNTIQEHVL
jgi:hypothetical protein